MGKRPWAASTSGRARRAASDFRVFFAFVEQSSTAASAGELFTLFVRAARGLGYEHACLTELSPTHGASRAKLGAQLDTVSAPRDWIGHYQSKRYVEIDPVVMNARRSRGRTAGPASCAGFAFRSPSWL